MVHTRPDGTISKDNTSFTAAQYILHEQCIDALHIKSPPCVSTDEGLDILHEQSRCTAYQEPLDMLLLVMGKLDPGHGKTGSCPRGSHGTGSNRCSSGGQIPYRDNTIN